MKLLLSGTHETICEKISVGFMFLIFNYVFLHFFFLIQSFHTTSSTVNIVSKVTQQILHCHS